MLGLRLDYMEITVNTVSGVFSTYIKFYNGLNVIRAENSSGKSTCVNAIVYALGLESVLGPRGKRPFSKALYENIENNKVEKKRFIVTHSFVELGVTNHEKRKATLKRDIHGLINKISITEEDGSNDYFLGASGKIGSSNSEKGFHNWLEKFLGWELPSVVTFDGKETKLYLECIFPLFFIEQKRGWSEIQANIPATWGIKNVKQNSIQFCLNVNDFTTERKLNNLESEVQKLKTKWEELRNLSQNIAEYSNIIIHNVSDINEKDGNFHIKFYHKDGDSLISINDKKFSIEKNIDNISNDENKIYLTDDFVNSIHVNIKFKREEVEKLNDKIELTLRSIFDSEEKISVIKNDLNQYQQLKRLRDVGSSVDTDLDTSVCPICDNFLYDTLGNKSAIGRPMNIDENIDFLKNQLSFFNMIKNNNHKKIVTYTNELNASSARLQEELKLFNDAKKDLSDFDGEQKNKLRRKVNAEIQLDNLVKLINKEDEINKEFAKLRASWLTKTEAIKKIKDSRLKYDFNLKLNLLQAKLRDNLKSFGFSSSPLESVSISSRTLRPEQEGYDIVAESSASDYIRIIWAYTIALLEIGGEYPDARHSGFVVFDEPRQQEASRFSFFQLINKASECGKFGGQIIFATSLEKEVLEDACKDKKINLWCFDDYILTQNN